MQADVGILLLPLELFYIPRRDKKLRRQVRVDEVNPFLSLTLSNGRHSPDNREHSPDKSAAFTRV